MSRRNRRILGQKVSTLLLKYKNGTEETVKSLGSSKSGKSLSVIHEDGSTSFVMIKRLESFQKV